MYDALENGEKGETAEQAEPLSSQPARRWLTAAQHRAQKPLGEDLSQMFSNVAQRLRVGLVDAVREEWAFGHIFLFLPVFLGLGACLWFSATQPFDLTGLIPCTTILVLLAIGTRHRQPAWHFGVQAFLWLSVGALVASVETDRQGTVMLDSPVTTYVSGRVVAREPGSQGEWRYTLVLNATHDPEIVRPPSRVSLVARSRHEAFRIGTDVMGRARLSPPSGPVLANMHDFGFSAYFEGIGAIGFFFGAPQSVTNAAGDGSHLSPGADLMTALNGYLLSLRGAISERIRTTITGDAGAFAAAIVTGERRALADDVLEDLRRSGLAHVIAISGLHMALAAGLFFVGLRLVFSQFGGFAQSWPIKKFAAAGALLAAFTYLLISGGQVSAVRAFVMLAIMLTAVLLDRPAISMRNVALAAAVILVWSPSEIMGPSFQMSFAATIALVAGYSAWRRRTSRDSYFAFLPSLPILGFLGRVFAGLIMTSLIGGVSTAIFALEHFHRLAAYSLAANLLAMPIISFLVMPAGLFAMLLMPVGLDALPLHVMGIGLDIVMAVAHEVASWGGEWTVERLPVWVLPLSVVGMLLLALLRSRLRHLGSLVICGVLVGAFAVPREPAADLLVYEDGRLLALVSKDALATNRTSPPHFVFDQWQEALRRHSHNAPLYLEDAALAQAIAPKEEGARWPQLPDEVMGQARMRMQAMLGQANSDRLLCLSRAWCVAEVKGRRLVSLEEPRFAGLACDLADIIIASRRIRFDHCRSGARLITSDMLRKTGSLELWFPEITAGPPKIRAAFHGNPRAWSIHRRFDWRSGDYDNKSVEAVLANFNDNGE